MQSVGSFGNNKITVTQYLVGDGSLVKIENTKIKKKSSPAMFKAISNLSTVTALTIRSCRLKKLPAEIGLLSNLRSLRIEDNLLTEVPSIDTLVELTDISFAYNQIKLFPNSLVKLEKLTSLDLSHNPIACIPGAVSQISSLIILHLDHTALPYFPVSICALPKIEELTCAGNKWGVFPEQVLQFTELRWLNLASNSISGVHPDIGKLLNLTYLDLADNTISSLPKEICNLTKLTTLLLQHNKLMQLPPDIGNMTSLVSLKLHDNQLPTLPESIGKLNNLIELYLQENEFTTLPDQLGGCTTLRTLRLGYNKLVTIPETLSKMAKLNVLMLHDNQMSEIPKVLTHPHFLKHLLRVTLHNNLFSEGIQNDINVMGALHFLQEMYAETSPQSLRKSNRTMRRNTSRSHMNRSHNRVPGLKSSTGSTGSNGSGESNDSSPDDGERPKLTKEPSLTNKLKVQARRRAISVGEVVPPTLSADTDSDSDGEPRAWKSQIEFRMRSGSVPNGTAPIPPYRAFQRVYEYLVDQLDLSEKRRDTVNSLPHEEKWKLLSNLSRESSLNLLVNTKPRSAPGSPTIVASPTRPTASSNLASLLPGSPSSPSLSIGSPLKSPRAPVFLSATLRSPSSNNLGVPRVTDNIRTTREMLTTQSVAWITTFAETGGIESILQGLSAVSSKKNKSEDDYSTILEYISCVTIMIGIGLESLLISNAVEVLVLNVDSDNLVVKEATISVLDEVCNVFYSGQGLVIDALTKKSPQPSEAFKPLCNSLGDPNVSMSMKAGCMKLINNLITNTDELEARCQIRNNFLKLGLQETINKIRESTGDEYQRLEQQIDHFDEVMNDDGEEIALRFKQGHVDGKELLLSSFGLDAKPTRDSQQVPVRVVLPSVSHTHMSCMVAQHPCDATTTTKDLISAILKEYGKGMGADPQQGAFGLYVVNGSKGSPAPGEKFDSTGGFFLDDNRYILPLAIDHVILDMRLRPWVISILIDKSIYDLVAPPTPKSSAGGVKPLPTVPEIQIEVEPKTTCGALLLQVLRRFLGDKGIEVEELAFFMEKEKKPTDKTGKTSSSGGVWLESTDKLIDYGHEVTKTKLQLKKMPKILKIILADESFEYVGYDEDTVIRSILLDTFQRLIAPSLSRGNAPSPSHYGLYFYNTEEPEIGEWLDPERTLRSYYLPNRAPLRYLLRPKALNVQYQPPPNFEGTPPKISNPLRVNFYAPIGGVLEKMGIPIEGSGIYLLNESIGNQYLDASLSLFNQNVPENSTIIIQPATKEVQAASVNIWDEPENATTIMYNVDNFNEIHAATINKLIERLTSEKDHDPDFTQVFEATYRSFMTHETLFAKLVERYIPPEHIPETPALNLVRLRVIVFLKNWIEHCGPDFPMNVMLSIEKFIDNQLCKGGHMNLAAQLKKMIQSWKAQNMNEVPREAPDLNYQMSNPTKIIHGFSSLVDEWGLALHMTMRESKLFAQIMPVEFFKQKGNEMFVAQMINNFNRVAAWVPIAILSEIKLVHRANAVERFIKLAWNLRQLNNFHLLTAVLSGLSNSAVLRLKWTFAKVAKRYKQMLEELEAVMGMEGSFKVYRQTLVEATPPCVPYIGVYLTDLVFIEDGNPDKVGNMVNWTKRRYMYNIITTFQRYQLAQYDEKQPSPSSPTHATPTLPRATVSDNKEANINTFLTFLNRMPILTDKQLYDMSMAREPRNADRRELM